MMIPFRVDPAKSLAELADAQRKVAGVLARLARMRDDEIEIGPTQKEEVRRIDKSALFHYALPGGTPDGRPVLILYALVGRYTVLDLEADRSLVRRLLSRRTMSMPSTGGCRPEPTALPALTTTSTTISTPTCARSAGGTGSTPSTCSASARAAC